VEDEFWLDSDNGMRGETKIIDKVAKWMGLVWIGWRGFVDERDNVLLMKAKRQKWESATTVAGGGL
jgi:hypothetical protein